jgi:hypothetical protein
MILRHAPEQNEAKQGKLTPQPMQTLRMARPKDR